MCNFGVLVGLFGVDLKVLKIIVVNLYVRVFDQLQCYFYIGLGDEGVGDVEDHVGVGVGCGY